MRAGGRGYLAHWVCPRLLEQDPRHGEHLAGIRHPLADHKGKAHDRKCGCLIDWEGHRASTLYIPPGEVLAADHPDLTCSCGVVLVPGQLLAGELVG